MLVHPAERVRRSESMSDSIKGFCPLILAHSENVFYILRTEKRGLGEITLREIQ